MAEKLPDTAELVAISKKQLGQEIANLRRVSQRKLAKQVDVPNSNLKYIEDGVNAPSPDLYERLIKALQPTHQQRQKLDSYYAVIRGTPPPDVCKIMVANNGINDAIRMLAGQTLSATQIKAVQELFSSFNKAMEKGATDNG